MTIVAVSCPATSANLGPGFDALGLALGLRNSFEIELRPAGFQVEAEGVGASRIPRDPHQNLVIQAFQATQQALGREPVKGLRLAMRLEVPPSRGLGSSATATVAGVVAANALAGELLDSAHVIELATGLEGHPDNVVPCLLGGFCAAVRDAGGSVTHLRAVPTPPPALIVAIPTDLELSTDAQRRVLPEQVPFQDAVWTSGRAALLTLALMQNDARALGEALQDRLHQPYRGENIPSWEAVRRAAIRAGAYGAVISGSGPTLLAMAPPDRAEPVREAMHRAWSFDDVANECRIVDLDREGTRVESS